MTARTVEGFELRVDVAHDLGSHTWVQVVAPGRVRIGMDPLGPETSGTLAQLSFAPVGTEVVRGNEMGSLEAEKFVGPVVTPMSGRVTAVNQAVLRDPGLVERDPYGEGWLVEIAPSALDAELAHLATDPAEIETGFAGQVAAFRADGILAE